MAVLHICVENLCGQTASVALAWKKSNKNSEKDSLWEENIIKMVWTLFSSGAKTIASA